VERDAFTCVWLARLSPPRIPNSGSFPDPALLPRGCDFRAYDITSDAAIPVTLVVLRGQSPVGRTVAIGTGAGIDRQTAAAKALMEAALSWYYVVWLQQHGPDWDPGERFEHVVDFPYHARVYTARPEHEHAFEFLDERECVADPLTASEVASDHGEHLRECVAKLAAIGIEVLVRELTTPDVEAVGLHVVRSIGVGLQPLHGNHHIPFLGARRLWEVASHFSFAERNPTIETLNPYPHPSG